jgi:hypothetical protein
VKQKHGRQEPVHGVCADVHAPLPQPNLRQRHRKGTVR